MVQRQLNWGILGTAKIGRSLASAVVRSKYSKPCAVASRSFEKAKAYAAENGFERAYGSYLSLLRDPLVDVIYVPLPNHLHCPWTIRALDAGKHVLCEKPLALNSQECRKMIAAARRNRRLLMEAFMYRFHPQTLRIQRLLEREVIGPVRIVRAAFGFSLDEESQNVRLVKRMGGGSLMDVGCYCVNAMRMIFGAEPIKVAGQAELGRTMKVDMSFGGVLLFSEGRLGLFNSSFRSAPDWGLEIVGAKGRILVPSPWKPDAHSTRLIVETRSGSREEEIREGGGIYDVEVDHFSRCVMRDEPPALAPEDGLKNMRVIEALRRSAHLNRAVALK